MHAEPDPQLVLLYQRAVICKTFPAYTLHELRNQPLREIMWAVQLLDIAQKVQS